VRNTRALTSSRLTHSIVDRWKRDNKPVLLLKIPKAAELPRSVKCYLETDAGRVARTAYKCRVRDPWYVVPDVQVPDFFLTYMAGLEPALLRNDAARSRGRRNLRPTAEAANVRTGDCGTGAHRLRPRREAPLVSALLKGVR
jgi:hypothetical protein